MLLSVLLAVFVSFNASAAEITATYMQSGTYDKAAELIEAEFEKASGIDVELVIAPWAVLNQNHITDLATGTGEFDVMSGEFWIASVFEHMLPLDEFVKRDNYGGTFIERIWSPGPSNFYEDKRIGVPYSADAYGIFYRSDIFEEHGIDANWKTWDDFIDRLKKLKEALTGTDIAPNVYAWGQPEQNPAIFLGMYDGYLVNKDGAYELEKDKAVAALDQMASLLEYNPSNAVGLNFNEANAVFLDGKAATLICWPSFARAEADDPDKSKVVGKWRLGHYPGPGFPMVSAWNLFISKYSENPEESWEWIKAYSNPERAKQFMADFGIGSPHRVTYEDEELLKLHAHDYPGQLANLSRAKSLPWTFEAFEIFFRNTGELIIGSINAAQVVENSHKAWSEINVPEALVEIANAQGLQQVE
jgi:multiple sugar transport system substrate-binding protein